MDCTALQLAARLPSMAMSRAARHASQRYVDATDEGGVFVVRGDEKKFKLRQERHIALSPTRRME